MVATFAYDAASRRTSRTLGDTPGTQTAWTYGRQDNLPTAINAGIPGASFTYTYDANKNKLTEGISSPMANYGFNSTSYDPADRLTAWNRTDGNLDQAWDLSLVGNWATFTENQVQQTRSHTAVHEIAAIDSAPIAHDAAGNLTRTAGDTLDRYTWDFDNRLATADVDQDGTAECGYRYDARGRRVSKTVPDGEGSLTTVFVYLGNQVVSEYPAEAAPGSPAHKFVYAEYIDEPVMMVATSGATTTPYYYHQNSLYSVAAITDVSGTVAERYAYSAYGKPIFLDAAANLLDPQASTIGNPHLFTGRRLDQETGLYYYRARMYDSELGRFVSRDPIGYEGSQWGLYEYVKSQPIIGLDPTGGQYYGGLPGDAGLVCDLQRGICYGSGLEPTPKPSRPIPGQGGNLIITGDCDDMPAFIYTLRTAVGNACDCFDKAQYLIENYTAAFDDYFALSVFGAGYMRVEKNRTKMLAMLKNVRGACNSPININCPCSCPEGTDAYVNFLVGTNIVVGSTIHVCPSFFELTHDRDATIMHEMGRFFNSLGEENTGTWADVYVWDSILRGLCTNYEYITEHYAKDWGAPN